MDEGTAADRFDHYNHKASDASRTAVAAVVLLNSGAWLAMMSQIASLAALEPRPSIGTPFLLWSGGASLGVLTWLFVYLSAYLIAAEFHHPNSSRLAFWISAMPLIGTLTFLGSIICFMSGAVTLAQSLL